MLNQRLSRMLSTIIVMLLMQLACSSLQANQDNNNNNIEETITPIVEQSSPQIQSLNPSLSLPINLETISSEKMHSLSQIGSLGSELLRWIEVSSDNKFLVTLTTERLEIYDLEKAEKVNEITRPLGFSYASNFGFQLWTQNQVDWFNADGTLYFSYPRKDKSLIGLYSRGYIYAMYENKAEVIDPNNRQVTEIVQGEKYLTLLDEIKQHSLPPISFKLFSNNTIAVIFEDRVDIFDLNAAKLILSVSKGDYKMQFSPSGAYIIFKSQDNSNTFTLNVFSEPKLISFATTNQEHFIFPTNDNYFALVDGNDVSIWETSTGNLVNRKKMERQGYISCCQFIDNSFVYGITPSTESEIYQFWKWDFLNNTMTPFFEGEDVTLSPSGEWALEATSLKNSDGSTSGNALPLEVFKTSNPKVKTELPNTEYHQGSYFSDDEKYVVIEFSNEVLIWELESASYKIRYSTGETTADNDLKLLSSNNRFLIAKIKSDNSNQWQVFDGETNNLLFEKKNTSYPIEKILVSPDGQSLITLDTNNNVAGWDLTTGKLIFQTYLEGYLLAFIPDSSGFITFDYTQYGDNEGYDPVVFRYTSLTDGSVITEMKSDFSIFDEWFDIDFSNDNTFFAAENRNDGMIGVWNLRNGEMIFSLASGNRFRYMDLSPNGKYLSYEESGTKVIDIATSKILFEVDANDYSQISPSSSLIFIYYNDRVDIWDFLNNELLGSVSYAQLQEGSDLTNNPTLSQLVQEDIDGLIAQVTGKNSLAKINGLGLDVSIYRSEENILTISDNAGNSDELVGHLGEISSYYFALDGKMIISHSMEDGTVRFWAVLYP